MIGRRVRLALAVAIVTLGVASGQTSRAFAAEGSYAAVETRIAVKLDDRLSSQDNKAGDAFTFELTGSVAVDGDFLAAGTHGHGVVVAVQSGLGVKPGFLTVEARSIDLPDGHTLAVGLATGSLDRRLTRESRNLAVPIGGSVAVRFGPSRSTNVVYEKGTSFIVVAPPPTPAAPS